VIYLQDIRRSIMSRQVTFDYSKAGSFISEEEIGYMKKLTLDAKETLVSKTGAGNDFLGWIDLPVDYDKEEFARIKAAAKKIQSDSDVLLVIGIGGSINSLCRALLAVFSFQLLLEYTESNSGLCGGTGLGDHVDGEISVAYYIHQVLQIGGADGVTTEVDLRSLTYTLIQYIVEAVA
jgi:hypothetical protein